MNRRKGDKPTSGVGIPTEGRKKGGPKGRMGRPSLLTPKVQEVICRYLARGVSLEAAAALAGISVRTLKAWRALGEEQPDGPYGDFLHATEEARGNAERLALSSIRRGMKKDWRAAAFFLTHAPRKPGEAWAPRARLEHTGADGSALPAAAPVTNVHVTTPVIDPRNVSPGTLEELTRVYAAAAAARAPEPAPAGGAAPVPGDRSGDPA